VKALLELEGKHQTSQLLDNATALRISNIVRYQKIRPVHRYIPLPSTSLISDTKERFSMYMFGPPT
jgi:hypothetical protein